jgi:tetratricopeptide (TPR) repeat protein
MPLGIPERFERAEVRVVHHGYRDDRIAARDKRRRNIELLEQEAPGPFTSFNLGTEHLAGGDTARAIPLLDEAWRAVAEERARAGGPLPQYVPALALRLVQARRLAGDHEGALAAAAEALAVYPDHTDVVREAALAARAAGDLDGAATLAERCLEQGDAPARYAGAVGAGGVLALSLLAEIRVEQGRTAEAEALLERCLDESPSAPGVRTRLEELRGSAPRLVDAALAGDVDGLADALGAARLAGTSPEELEVYRGWLAVLEGGRPEALPAECANPAAALLDELLRREAFAAFEVVLRVWEKIDLPGRELREALARIYLGRGFLDSAADEWLEVAGDGADARVYAGLARVAAARGLRDDALELAAEAARLDPANHDARALLEWAHTQGEERVHAA